MRYLFELTSCLAASAAATSDAFFIDRLRSANSADALARRQSSTIKWPYQKFHSEPTFLPPVPEIIRHGETSPGYFFLAQQGLAAAQQAAMIMTDDGDLIWQSDPNSEFPATNFSPQMLNGRPVLVYNMALGTSIVESGAVTYSVVQIFDDSYNLLCNVSVSDPTFTFASGEWSSIIDSHEAFITEQDTLLIPAYNITPWDLSSVGGPKDGWILDSLFYEVTIPEGEILYSWRTSDHIPATDAMIPLDALYGFGNSSEWAWDYFHINSIQPWGDDGYLISDRNTFDILFVNKTTNNIEWRLRGNDGGEFELDPRAHFKYQHDARLHHKDGELLLSYFNNNNTLDELDGVPSAGHLLVLDIAAKTAEVKGIYTNETANIASEFGGSMQAKIHGDHTFAVVGHGSQPVIEEFDLDGTEMLSFKFGPSDPGAATQGIANYRVTKQTWKGYPTTSPSIKACATVGGADVYVSWNGATEVSEWVLYAGAKESKLEKKVTVPKTGFETKISIDGKISMVKVQAKGNEHDHRFVAASSTTVSIQQC